MSDAELYAACDVWLARHLEHPETRKVRWGRTGEAWITGYLAGVSGLTPGNVFGYGVHAAVNHKDQSGQYTGNWRWQFFVRDNKVLWADHRTSKNGWIYAAGVEFVDD